MEQPFESGLPPWLTNFNFKNTYDEEVYRFIEKHTPHREHIQRLQRIRAKAEESEPRDPAADVLNKAMIQAAEMEMLVMLLDLKICLLAKHVWEPYPGYFEKVR